MDKARFEILTTYAIVALCGILGSIPTYDIQNLSMLLSLITLIMLYLIRAREKSPDTLMHHHATFMIRTIWIYSVIFVFAFSGAVATVYQIGDQSAFNTMLNDAMQGVIPSHEGMEAVAIGYMADNRNIFISWLALPLFYILWRVTRGGTRAAKNYRVQNLYAWF